jgi:hypothetical protein
MRARKLLDFDSGSEVAGLTYQPDSLIVSLGSGRSVVCLEVLGFRVLDEGDLLEFWPQCSARNGGLFEVEEGGWFSQESLRKGFISAHQQLEVLEFFITGPNSCVNVLAFARPSLSADAL